MNLSALQATSSYRERQLFSKMLAFRIYQGIPRF